MVVNYPGADVDFTRIVEYKHMANQTEARGVTMPNPMNSACDAAQALLFVTAAVAASGTRTPVLADALVAEAAVTRSCRCEWPLVAQSTGAMLLLQRPGLQGGVRRTAHARFMW